MSLMDRIKKEAAESGGFKPHPTGTFPGTIEEVKERTVKTKDGHESTVYDIYARTSEGRARMSVWKNTVADVEDGFRGTKTREEAEEIYVKGLARLMRLYTDLGLPEPTGKDEIDLEGAIYEGLGNLQGQVCEVVVQARKDGDTQNPNVYLNAPRQVPSSGRTAAKAAVPATTAKPAAARPAKAATRPQPAAIEDIDALF